MYMVSITYNKDDDRWTRKCPNQVGYLSFQPTPVKKSIGIININS